MSNREKLINHYCINPWLSPIPLWAVSEGWEWDCEINKLVHHTDDPISKPKEKSDGSTADYYKLPEGATELQDLISYKNMNAQIGEIQRAVYRYGQVAHSEMLRDAKKIKFYIEAEIKRLEKYNHG